MAGKAVLITGGSRGIGRATALPLAQMGSVGVHHRPRRRALAGLPRLDVLVNNVGGYWNTRHITVDGLERTFAVNHLAPSLLTSLLLERLTSTGPARVVTVASKAESLGRIHFDDLEGARRHSGDRAYNQSKLANVLFTHELARRTAGAGITANVLHPGLVSTAFGASDPGRSQRLIVPWPVVCGRRARNS